MTLRRARAPMWCAAAAFLFAGCGDDSQDTNERHDAGACEPSFERAVVLESERGLFTLTFDCPDPHGCEAKDLIAGTGLEVSIDLSEVPAPKHSLELLSAAGDPISVSLEDRVDSCTGRSFAHGWLWLASGDASRLVISKAGAEVDRLVFHTPRVASVQLEATDSGDGGAAFSALSEVRLQKGEALTLRAQALDADDEPLVTPDAVFWIDDASLAVLGDHAEAGLRATEVTLHALAKGETELHVLVSNIEHVVPLLVR